MAILKSTSINDTGYLGLPNGTTAQRPSSPSAGYMRWNTTESHVELYDGSNWVPWNVSSGPDIITDSLILHYSTLSSNSYGGTGTTWYDLSGNGVNASIAGNPTFVSGTPSYFDMDGSDDIFTVTGRDWRQNFTFEIWTQVDNNAAANGLFGQGPPGNSTGMHILTNPTTSRGMIFAFYANDNDYQGNYTFSNNTWYHWVFTYNHSTYNKEFYADGVLQTPGASVENAYAGTGDWKIGGIYNTGGSKIAGKISIVRAYTKTLSQSEVQHNYNAQKTTFGK